ncbi:sensor domain-containing diguanylate cyclase [Vibrio algarum]
MAEAYNELEVIFNNALVGILVVDKDRVVQRVNQTFVDMIGFDRPEDWVGRSSREIHLSDEAYDQFGEKFHSSLINREVVDFDYQVRNRDGKPIWVAISGKAIDTNLPADLEKGVVWVTRDINKRKLMEEQLIKLTREDPLTGLFNRRYFIESSDRELKLMRRYNKSLSLLTIDIDHFKSINDTFGHNIGDKALIFFTQICSDIVRNIDIVGRMGGEEFTILLIESNLDQASDIAHRILSTLAKKSMLHKDIPSMSASIGVVQIEPKETLQSAMKRADKLLYTAKKNGRSRVCSQ